MIKKNWLFAALVLGFVSCQKDYSEEGSSSANGDIVGADCRISKIAYLDSATNIGKGAVTAIINTADNVTSVTNFDSLSLTLDYNSVPVYISDTIKINADEYFVVDASTKRVIKLHRLIDPTNPFSPPIDVNYAYDGSGVLVQKIATFTLLGIPTPIIQTDYSYTAGNLTGMLSSDLITGDKITDAVVTYNTSIAPKNFIYIFPDEDEYANYTQFLNFGKKSTNAISGLTLNTYDPGNVLKTTEVTTFSSYVLSRDNYVRSVIMKGNDQLSIPAIAGKLKFDYHCK